MLRHGRRRFRRRVRAALWETGTRVRGRRRWRRSGTLAWAWKRRSCSERALRKSAGRREAPRRNEGRSNRRRDEDRRAPALEPTAGRRRTALAFVSPFAARRPRPATRIARRPRRTRSQTRRRISARRTEPPPASPLCASKVPDRRSFGTRRHPEGERRQR